MDPLPAFPQQSLLSPKQLEVANYLVHGFTNKEPARELHISHRTIEDHRRDIFRRLALETAFNSRGSSIRSTSYSPSDFEPGGLF
jgi:DNA-binding NarL/FixJ family response regulator